MAGKRFTSIELDQEVAFGWEPTQLVDRLREAVGGRDPKRIGDLGAGTGVHAIAVARAWPAAQVYAFEPSSDMCAHLRANTKASGLQNLFPMQQSTQELHESGRAPFDAVVVNLVAYFAKGIPDFIVQVGAVANPGATILFNDFALPSQEAGNRDGFSRSLFDAYFPGLGPLWSQQQFEQEFAGRGLSVVGVKPFDPGVVGPGLPESVVSMRENAHRELAGRMGLDQAEVPRMPPALSWVLRKG